MVYYLSATEILKTPSKNPTSLLKCVAKPCNSVLLQTTSKWIFAATGNRFYYEISAHSENPSVRVYSVRTGVPHWAIIKGTSKETIMDADWRNESPFII